MCTASPVARSEYDPGVNVPFMSRTSGITRCVLWKQVRSIQAGRFTICKPEWLGGETTAETSRRNRKPGAAMKAAIAFAERINTCDVEGLCELMTEDHRFVDSNGAAHVGRKRM